MRLEHLAKVVADTRGLAHTLYLNDLRGYIKDTSETQLLEEIEKFTEIRYLKALWEAGLSANLQQAVLEQIKEIS